MQPSLSFISRNFPSFPFETLCPFTNSPFTPFLASDNKSVVSVNRCLCKLDCSSYLIYMGVAGSICPFETDLFYLAFKSSRLIHIASCAIISFFFFKAEYYYMVCTCITFFFCIHPLLDTWNAIFWLL